PSASPEPALGRRRQSGRRYGASPDASARTHSRDGARLFLDVERTEARTDLLDLRGGELAPLLVEDRLAAVHFGNPFASEGAVADRRENGAHVAADVLVDDLRPDRVRAVLR